MNLDFNNFVPELHYYIHRKCTPDWKIEPDITPFVDLTYVIAGRASYTIGNTEYMVKAGDLLCIPKGIYRTAANVSGDLMECYSANFFLRSQSGEDVSFPIPIVSHLGRVPQLISCFHDINSEWIRQEFGYMLRVRATLCLILYQIANLLLNNSYLNPEDLRIKNSIHYLYAHYSEPITIQTMAEHFHLHPAYYGNLFRRVTGITFKQYLLTLRLNHAEDLLKSGEYSVTEVAAQCGFPDIFYFSKLFKEKKGISPSNCFQRSKNID
ncbi:MAG: AraC family transcriptional regulator [Hungatella sp.]|jgi:AraC-like DNA-binding protein|nr:AraC family transcriptional regulator [Hungatella sp.]